MKYLYRCLILLLVLLCGGISWLVGTQSGLRFIQTSCSRLPGLSIGSVSGRIWDHMQVDNIRYETSSADYRLASLEVAWRPWRLLSGELDLVSIIGTGLDIQSKEGGGESAPAPPQEKEGKGSLPVVPLAITIADLQLRGMRFLAADGEELLAFTGILLQLRKQERLLELQKLFIDGPEMGCDLHGSLNLDSDLVVNLLGSWRIAGFGFLPSTGTLSADGPLNSPQVHVKLDSPADIRVSGRFNELLSNAQWTATLEARDVDLSTWIISCPQILLHRVHGDLYGDFGHYRGRVEADGRWAGFDQLHLVTDIDGDDLGIRFLSQQVTRKDGVANGYNASINWRNIFGWEGEFAARNFDLSALGVGFDSRLDGKFTSKGEVLDEGLLASFRIDDIHGEIANQPLQLAGELTLTEKGVQTENMVVHSGQLEGFATVNRASFSWDPEMQWSVDVELNRFSPALLHPMLQGEVSAVVASEGKIDDRGPEGFVRLQALKGYLNNQELRGGGEIQVSGTGFSSTGLELQAGPSILQVKGSAGAKLGLEFSFSSSDISSVFAGSKGSVYGRGFLTGSPSAPDFELKADGNDVQYGSTIVGYGAISTKGKWRQDAPLEGRIRLENTTFGDFAIDDAELRARGTLAQHSFYFTVDADSAKLELQVRGSYDKSWQGTLSSLRFADEHLGTWNQRGETKITLGNEKLVMDDLCMLEGASELCLQSAMQFSDELPWSMVLNGGNLPLSWLHRWQLVDFPLKGEIEAELHARGDKNAISAASLTATTKEATFEVETEHGEKARLHVTEGHLTSKLAGKVLTTGFSLATATGGELNGAISLGNIGEYRQIGELLHSSPLHGDISVQNFDIAFLSGITGYWVQPKGHLYTTLKVDGTLQRPRLQGSGFVRDGGLVLPDQGIELDGIQFRLDGESEILKIYSKASSGPGEITADGELRFTDGGVVVEMLIEGEDFLLVELPEYVFRITPKVRFSYQDGAAAVAGDVSVVHGSITLEQIQNAVTASTDVVFINDTGKEEKAGLPIVLDLRVTLGDDVQISGYGVKGKLRGRLQIRTDSSGLLTGKGEVDLIDGNFSIYGRSLDIARGRVLFNGGPIDNPGVDIRAQKKVSEEQAKGKGYTVGVDISGLVQDLQFQLFSDPYMDDTEILSLMVVGHSLAASSSEEGNMLLNAAETLGLKGSSKIMASVGEVLTLDDLHIEGSRKDEDLSLVVGKRITSDLYIGYDVNVFSQLGQFRVRYDLKHGFWVETRSSSEATGADLFYSFER
jgi:translocation and assembly module TamB